MLQVKNISSHKCEKIAADMDIESYQNEKHFLCIETLNFLCTENLVQRGMLVICMQRFRGVYHVISHESLVISRYTQEPFDISWYTTRECCITIFHNAIENTVGHTINVTYTRRMRSQGWM